MPNLNLDRMRTDSYSYHIKRQRFLAAGSIAGIVAFVYTAYLLKQEISKPTKFDSGLPKNADPFLTEAGSKRKTVVHDQEGREMVPTGNTTIQWFPRTLELEAGAGDGQEVHNGVQYTLVGLGTRTVTFLGFEVYVVGYYIATSDVAAIQARLIKDINPIATTLVPSERDELRRRLLDPVEGEKLWLDILKEVKPRSAMRIIPVRNTDFPHLRDGFVRAITAKSQANKQEYNDEAFGAAMTEFRGMFNRGKLPAKGELIMVRDERGALTIMYDDGKQQKQKTENEKVLGTIGRVLDERVSRALWLNYLAGKAVASEPARKNIVDGIMEFVERPIGTVAAQVL
ncbi:Altered inheritance of mitochondria protein 18 mitochondrial [Pestalotiopsis sp. 9143b]|nr:Altered inheritance of mitochondria protein 18 mitochondrial [Pestalotiopsis sp. 9143b]